MASSNYLLKVEGLKAFYRAGSSRVKAVDDVSIAVKKSEILGIAGESGCGKSTFALAVLRLLKPPGYIEDGEILLNGVDILKLSDKELKKVRWSRMSYIPQSSMNALNPVMRTEEQINDAILTRGRKMPKAELRKRVGELLADVGLAPEVARMYPHELSGGMRQRVIIAMAIALNPELVVADEPTTALDVVVQRGILQMLSEIRWKFGSSIVVITHDMAAQAEIVDRLAIMYAGKIVEAGGVKEVFDEPLHPYTHALISSVPSIKVKKELLGLSGLPPDLRNPPSGCYFHPRCSKSIRNRCEIEEPEFVEIEKDRFVACHLCG
mgnify:CR=1 FL=1